jgi:hypothetical protein
MIQWFGKDWGAPICEDADHVETPAGALCGFCEEPIEAADDGFVMTVLGEFVADQAFHYECHMRQVFGGVNHQLGCCYCCGGNEPPDPPHLSKREAARQAADMVAVFKAQAVDPRLSFDDDQYG